MSTQPLHSLIYVSFSCLSPARDATEIARIVTVSRSRNATLDVTGSLIATQGYFAQILEGPEVAIEALMASIERDARHAAVTVVRRETLPARRFASWAMAYSGDAGYIDRDIVPHLAPPGDPASALPTDRLVRLFKAFADVAPC